MSDFFNIVEYITNNLFLSFRLSFPIATSSSFPTDAAVATERNSRRSRKSLCRAKVWTLVDISQLIHVYFVILVMNTILTVAKMLNHHCLYL